MKNSFLILAIVYFGLSQIANSQTYSKTPLNETDSAQIKKYTEKIINYKSKNKTK